MIITPLWHTEFLIDIANSDNQNVRILVDSWLSDVVIWDLMERTPRIELDPTTFASIDAIYISHSHTDHLDPYTLVEIYQHATPLLILPYTLRYLESVFAEFLPNAPIHFLHPKAPYILKWVEITGYMFAQGDITNEDDVMMLAVANSHELLFAEIDTVPDEYDEVVQNELFRIFDRKEYQTRIYLSSRNELEWQLRWYDYDEKRRKSFRAEFIAGKKEEMRDRYEKFEYEEYADLPNIYTLPGFVRGFIGQGLQYPVSLSQSLSELSIFPLDEIMSMEIDIARSFGYDFSQRALLPGRQYRVENGTIEQGRKECPIGKIIRWVNQSTVPNDEKRVFASGPLLPRELSTSEIEEASQRILHILNTRFLPYWSASPVASLRSALLSSPDGIYRIECKMEWSSSLIFEYSFAQTGFVQVTSSPDMRIDEEYWFLDILDFLEWRQELYSNFWHTLTRKRIYRFWTCLGANFMNHDLVIAKYRFHFDRASRGENVREWVDGILENLQN